MGKILVIETIEQDRTEWGISFTSHNPEAHDYFRCESKGEAFRLKNRIEQFINEAKAN